MIKIIILLLTFLTLVDCRLSHFKWFGKGVPDSEIQPCDQMGNSYEGGSHYIRRDFLNQDGLPSEATLDYKKMFEYYHNEEYSNCFPKKEGLSQ